MTQQEIVIETENTDPENTNTETPTSIESDLIYGLEARPPFVEAIFVALQHVFACFVGIITPGLIICGALEVPPADTTFILSMSLVVSGIATFIQAKRFGPVGSGLLSVQGTSFAFLGPIIGAGLAVKETGGTAQDALSLIFGLCFFGAFVEIFVSRFLHLANKVITPLVTGVVVTLIGLTLIKVGITSMGGGVAAQNNGDFGSPVYPGVSFLVLAVIIALNSTTNNYLRMSSIVIGLVVGYLVSIPLGLVDFSNLAGLPPIALPIPFRYGFSFNFAAFIPFAFLYLITAIETIGDLTTTSAISGEPIEGPKYFRRIKGGVLGDGINSIIAACLNTFPNTSFSQNNGVIQLTGVGSRYVGYFISAFFVILGLFPIIAGTFQALRQAGYEVEIYEKTRKLRPAGAGISLWSNGIKILNKLGLGEKVAAIGGQMNRMEYLTHKGESLNNVNLIPLMEQVGQRPYPVSRTDLQQMMLDAFGESDVQMGMRCVEVKQDADSATAIFEDGSTATGDVVIGADGVHSVVRTYLAGGKITPRYAGYVNWNGLVDASPDLAEEDVWVIYVGDGKRASMMPVGGGRFYYFMGCPKPQGTTAPNGDIRAELKETFAGWAQPVQNLIEKLDPEQTNRLEIGDIDPLPSLVEGRIALVGDSAHATTPTLGQGGCQAMEDAEVLCRYLVTTNISVEDALKRYEAERKERVAKLVLKARKRTDTIYNKEPDLTKQWYEQLKQEKAEDVTGAIAKIILGGPLH